MNILILVLLGVGVARHITSILDYKRKTGDYSMDIFWHLLIAGGYVAATFYQGIKVVALS